jgi:hypothetical protein
MLSAGTGTSGFGGTRQCLFLEDTEWARKLRCIVFAWNFARFGIMKLAQRRPTMQDPTLIKAARVEYSVGSAR